jgi:hypothetical protein
MTPAFTAALAEVGLLVAVLMGMSLAVLAIGWSVLAWIEAVWNRRDRERQRLLLARLYELEVACGGEFPQVGATVQYVRRLVLEQPEAGDVVAWRAGLRLAAANDLEGRRDG